MRLELGDERKFLKIMSGTVSYSYRMDLNITCEDKSFGERERERGGLHEEMQKTKYLSCNQGPIVLQITNHKTLFCPIDDAKLLITFKVSRNDWFLQELERTWEFPILLGFALEK